MGPDGPEPSRSSATAPAERRPPTSTACAWSDLRASALSGESARPPGASLRVRQCGPPAAA